jgi:hypothetical protein
MHGRCDPPHIENADDHGDAYMASEHAEQTAKTRCTEGNGNKDDPRKDAVREKLRHENEEHVRRGRRPHRLTDPSSATEAGEKRRKHGIDLTASLCSLERVVRRWGETVPRGNSGWRGGNSLND